MRFLRFAGAGMLLLLALTPSCSGGRAEGTAPRASSSLIVHRGEFRERFLLTGELEAVRADDLVAPRTPTWAITIRWMEADGAVVSAGQKAVEFDNSAFSNDIEQKRLAQAQSESEMQKSADNIAAQLRDHEFTLEQRRVALEKARTDAEVPEDILPRRTHQERQLALRRALIEYDKAKDDLDSYRKSSRADLDNRKIALEKARREIATAEQAIEALTLRAPRAGILVVADHPWEERKFQVGDTVYVGWTVMRIPDLSAMRVVAQLSDVDDGRIAAGMPAVCTVDAYPDQSFPGVISELTPVAQEPASQSLRRSFRVRLDLAKTDPERLRPGMSVKVEVEARRVSGALLAPRAGLDFATDPPRAILPNGRTAEVRLGPCNAEECVVESGLAEGARLEPRG